MMTIAEEIDYLDTKLTNINAKIDKQEHLKEVEEGGASARFRTAFTNIDSLYKERDKIKLRLITLKQGIAY